MIDEIFNKLYKNKRYAPIMKEALGDGSSDVDMIEKIYQETIEELHDYIDSEKSIMMAVNCSRFVFYRSLGMYTDIRNGDDETLIRANAQEIYGQNGIQISSQDDVSLHCYRKSDGQYIQIYPFERFVVDTINFRSFRDNAIFYKFAKTPASKDQISQIESNYYVRQYKWGKVIEMLENFKYKYIQTVVGRSTNEIENNQLIFTPDTVTKDTNASEESKITVAGATGGDGITLRLYTNQLIADDRPRTLKNATEMIINSCEKIKSKLSSKSTDAIKNGLHFEKDVDKNGRKKKSSKAFKIMTSNTPTQNRKVISNALTVVDVYEDATKQANKGIFDKDYENSGLFNKDLQVYLPEILSPYVLIHNACQWATMGGNSGFKILQNVVGSTGESFLSVPCYIGFYTSSGNMLADSYAWINGKFVDISTKGGLNGKGAAASIASLRKYIYQTAENGKDLTNELTPKGESVKQYFPIEFEIFDLLSRDSKATAEQVYKILKENGVWKGPLSTKNSVGTVVNNFMKEHTNFTGLIMEILQSASYDFVQMNCLPTNEGEDFHFTYKCQYPAIFEGDVDIHFGTSGFTKFHIV